MKLSKHFGIAALCLLISSADIRAAEVVSPTNMPAKDISGTVTLGGTYQQVAAANSSRFNCTIQNPADASEVLNVKIGTMAQPYVLDAGQSISTNNGTVNLTSAITVTAATDGHPFAGTCS